MNAILLLSISVIAQADRVDFDNDIIPILTKAGCNTAACHGSAAGRGGFKLSLYGGNPEADYNAIVRQYEGRRIDHIEPKQSLLLAKPTGEMEHGGDVRLDGDGPHAAMLARWIDKGAPRRSTSTRLVRLDVSASERYVETLPAQVQIDATAVYAGGVRRNVNDLAVFTAEDDAAVRVTAGGKATLLRRGRHNVIVRYLTEVVAITLTAPLYDQPIDLSAARRGNFIDEEIYATLDELRLPPSPPANPHTMLRRLRLDLTGRLPTSEEIADLDSRIADWKRDHPDSAFRIPHSSIDDLLASDDFTQYWTHRLGQWLRVGPAGGNKAYAQSYHDWIRTCVQRRTPLNKMAAALVTADGASGPANFYRAAPDARGQAEHFSEVLMGVRLRCANCHNHPLDRWTQDDYHGLAAMFAKLERGKTIRFIGRGEVSHPATGEAAGPKLPGGDFLSPEGDHRQALAQWLVSNDNPQFARAIVNRLWQAMTGRGLVEPIDDFRGTNPATHPRLLDRLTEDFIAHNYDLRRTLRRIATSAAYARSSTPTAKNAADDRYYARGLRKPLSAEVLLDAIVEVTGSDVSDAGELKLRTIALSGPVTPVPELVLLGQCDRKASCGGAAAGDITRQLALLNGDILNRRIESRDGRLAELMNVENSNDAIVEHFYLRALSRPPTEEESAHWRRQLAGNDAQRRATLEDFVWSLLNCDEFTHRY